ncbi:hypothetical protein [Streptomyces marincola]|uniref:hypothetical protein n=1 Tax=Streptomyces marincola TaxID=2878388 RepID=UPI00210058BA|nr:hypothetical protein [Streptomyces marincola]
MVKRKKSAFGGLGRWWGVLTGLLLVAAWVNAAAGPAVVLTLSAATLLWCAVQAPVVCRAPVRVRGQDDGCRNNAYGLLLGCHLRQHRWRKLRMLLLRRRAREFGTALFADAQHTVVTLAGVGSFLSGVVTFVPGLAI